MTDATVDLGDGVTALVRRHTNTMLRGTCPYCVPSPHIESFYVMLRSGVYHCFAGCFSHGSLSDKEWRRLKALSAGQ